jgi:hypothetical protein
LVGEKDRGLAMGLNDLRLFRRWTVAFLSGYIAEKYGITPTLSIWDWNFHNWIFTDFAFVKDTRLFVQAEVHPIKPKN